MAAKPSSIVQWVADFRNTYPPDAAVLTVQLAECTIRVECNHAELAAQLAGDLRGYEVADAPPPDITITVIEAPAPTLDVPFEVYPPGPGKTTVKDEYFDYADGRMLHKCRTGMLFCFGSGGLLALGPALRNRNQVLNFINNRFIRWNLERGYLLCHAAGIARDGTGLALAGISGAGKSTLALDLISAGCDFVSNDRLMIRRHPAGHLEMLGVPKMPRVNPGTILHNPHLACLLTPDERAAFAALPTHELWPLEQKYDADIETCFGPGRVQLAAPLTGCVLLTWRLGAGTPQLKNVRLAERPDLVRALAKPLGVHHHAPGLNTPPTVKLSNYLTLLKDCPVLEVAGGVDFAQATTGCLAFLAEHAGRPAAESA